MDFKDLPLVKVLAEKKKMNWFQDLMPLTKAWALIPCKKALKQRTKKFESCREER